MIIACGDLTNRQGCHGNCSGGLYVCVQITIVEGTGIKQIQPKSGLLPEAIFTGLAPHGLLHHVMYCLRHLLLFTCKQGCLQACNYDQSLSVMKPTYPQSFMLMYCLLFELWVSNLKEEKEEEKKVKNSAHHSPIHL